MSEVTRLDRVQILEEPKLIPGDDGSTTKVLAIEQPSTDNEPPKVFAGVYTAVEMCELLAEFEDRVVARQRGTYVVGLVNGQSITQRVVKEKYWGGTNKPFYDKRIKRAQRIVGKTVLSHIATS